MSSHLTRAIELYEHRIRCALARHIPCALETCVEAGGHCVTCRDEVWPCATRRALMPSADGDGEPDDAVTAA